MTNVCTDHSTKAWESQCEHRWCNKVLITTLFLIPGIATWFLWKRTVPENKKQLLYSQHRRYSTRWIQMTSGWGNNTGWNKYLSSFLRSYPQPWNHSGCFWPYLRVSLINDLYFFLQLNWVNSQLIHLIWSCVYSAELCMLAKCGIPERLHVIYLTFIKSSISMHLSKILIDSFTVSALSLRR